MNIAIVPKTMSSIEIAELTGKRHDHVMRDIRAMLTDLKIDLPIFGAVYIAGNGQEQPCFNLPHDETICLLTGYDAKARMAVIKRWQELEASAPIVAIPDFSSPAAAARAWADEFEAKNAALAIAVIATATKAEIGNRREATAMNTASQAVKKAAALEIELDRSKLYASVKRMEMLYHGQKFEWRKLKSGGQEMGIEPMDIFDSNYGTVKAYHADVWREVYAMPIEVAACEGVAA